MTDEAARWLHDAVGFSAKTTYRGGIVEGVAGNGKPEDAKSESPVTQFLLRGCVIIRCIALDDT